MSLVRLEASGCLNNPGRDSNGGDILKFAMNSLPIQTSKDSAEEAILHEAWKRTRAKMFDDGWSDMVSGDSTILEEVMKREAKKYAASPYY